MLMKFLSQYSVQTGKMLKVQKMRRVMGFRSTNITRAKTRDVMRKTFFSTDNTLVTRAADLIKKPRAWRELVAATRCDEQIVAITKSSRAVGLTWRMRATAIESCIRLYRRNVRLWRINRFLQNVLSPAVVDDVLFPVTPFAPTRRLCAAA